MTDSINYAIAHLRWPLYEISGSGCLAVVLTCCARVVLTAMPMEAQAVAAERCGSDCSHSVAPDGGWHRIIRIDQPPKETRPVITRVPGAWEK